MEETNRKHTSDERESNAGSESSGFASMWEAMGQMSSEDMSRMMRGMNSEDMAKMMRGMNSEDMAKMMRSMNSGDMTKMMEACCPDGMDMCDCMGMMMRMFGGEKTESEG